MPSAHSRNITNVVWRPQPGPQHALIDCPLPEIFYGGARGGGKTDGVLGKYALKEQQHGAAFNAIFFRRELPMLDDAIERSRQIYEPLGGEYIEYKKTWRLPHGGRLRFRPLEKISDAEKYQGQNVSDACVEEAGQYPDSAPIDRLNGVLRSVAGVPTQLILTGNPGGAGHTWIKARYIDPAPLGMKILRRELPGGRVHKFVYIPSRVQNNRELMRNDPDYINRLYLVGSESLVKAWLEGDWDVVEGAYFDCWSSAMVIKPFTIPASWTKFRSFDWGSAKPFSVGWWAVSDGTLGYPKGALIRYREWYGATGPNKGVKMHAEIVGSGIKEREDETVDYGVADPAIFTEDGGPSIAQRMGVHFRAADNKRIPGWDQMRQRMQGEDGRPMIYCFSTCVDSIRTIPALQHDKVKPEDLDSDGEDHCFAAGTLVDTDHGLTPIEDIIAGFHSVWSCGGWREVSRARMTKQNTKTIRLTFASGVVIVCTPEHLFMDFLGEWRYAKDLLGKEVLCDQSFLAQGNNNSTVKPIISVASTTNEKVRGCTVLCGNTTTGASPKDVTFTIETGTEGTTASTTLNCCHPANISAGGMAKDMPRQVERISLKQEQPQQFGIVAKMAGGGTRNISGSVSCLLCSQKQRPSASTVDASTWWLSKRKNKGSGAGIIVKPEHCVSVEENSPADVYCLTVPSTASFTIEGGFVVHNCADEWRYACMSRPWIKVVSSPDDKDSWDYAFDGDEDEDSWKTA